MQQDTHCWYSIKWNIVHGNGLERISQVLHEGLDEHEHPSEKSRIGSIHVLDWITLLKHSHDDLIQLSDEGPETERHLVCVFPDTRYPTMYQQLKNIVIEHLQCASERFDGVHLVTEPKAVDELIKRIKMYIRILEEAYCTLPVYEAILGEELPFVAKRKAHKRMTSDCLQKGVLSLILAQLKLEYIEAKRRLTDDACLREGIGQANATAKLVNQILQISEGTSTSGYLMVGCCSPESIEEICRVIGISVEIEPACSASSERNTESQSRSNDLIVLPRRCKYLGADKHNMYFRSVANEVVMYYISRSYLKTNQWIVPGQEFPAEYRLGWSEHRLHEVSFSGYGTTISRDGEILLQYSHSGTGESRLNEWSNRCVVLLTDHRTAERKAVAELCRRTALDIFTTLDATPVSLLEISLKPFEHSVDPEWFLAVDQLSDEIAKSGAMHRKIVSVPIDQIVASLGLLRNVASGGVRWGSGGACPQALEDVHCLAGDLEVVHD